MQGKMYTSAAACITNNQIFLYLFFFSFFEKWQKLERMLHRTGGSLPHVLRAFSV
jgi:hypothetical protein